MAGELVLEKQSEESLLVQSPENYFKRLQASKSLHGYNKSIIFRLLATLTRLHSKMLKLT